MQQAATSCPHYYAAPWWPQEFEIFISPEQYAAAGIAHLHLPTIDFLYAPPVGEMHRGVDFIHSEAWRAPPRVPCSSSERHQDVGQHDGRWHLSGHESRALRKLLPAPALLVHLLV
jgi:hypothetical protein